MSQTLRDYHLYLIPIEYHMRLTESDGGGEVNTIGWDPGWTRQVIKVVATNRDVALAHVKRRNGLDSEGWRTKMRAAGKEDSQGTRILEDEITDHGQIDAFLLEYTL